MKTSAHQLDTLRSVALSATDLLLIVVQLDDVSAPSSAADRFKYYTTKRRIWRALLRCHDCNMAAVLDEMSDTGLLDPMPQGYGI